MYQHKDLVAAQDLLQQYFASKNLAELLPPLPLTPRPRDYKDAFAVRDQLANLFLGDRPFFTRPTHPASAMKTREDTEKICQ